MGAGFALLNIMRLTTHTIPENPITISEKHNAHRNSLFDGNTGPFSSSMKVRALAIRPQSERRKTSPGGTNINVYINYSKDTRLVAATKLYLTH